MTTSAPPGVLRPADAGPARSRRRRVGAPLVTIGSLALATLALHLRDPHEQGSWGLCPSAALGIWCPGCGGLRAMNDLTHGQVGAAASSNLLLVVALPFVVAALAWWLVTAWRGTSRRWAADALVRWAPAIFAVLAAFTVARNAPMGAWLAP